MKHLMIAAVASAFSTVALSTPRGSETPSAGGDEVTQLRGLVTDLQRQVDELKAKNDNTWLTEARADEVRGLVQDVLADADTRVSLLQSGATAGYDSAFFIGSADGNYLLKINGQIQVRAVYNWQDDEASSDSNRFGFENRRTKVQFLGHVFDPSWKYYIELDASRSGGGFSLGENGWVEKDMGNGWAVRFGQFKPMYLREESVSSKKLLGVERSQVNAEFTAGTAQGVQAAYAADQWRVFASFIDGLQTANTAWSNEDTEYAFTSRAELLLQGDWKAVDDDNGWKGGDGALLLGAGLAYQNGEYGTISGPEVSNLGLTADITWKSNGWSVAGAVIYRRLETDTGSPADVDLDQIAFVIRGGFFVRDDIELYATYEWGDLDLDAVETLSTITVGVNKYWNKHNLKWQTDLGFGLDEVDSEWATDSAGWRADPDGEEGQVVFRSQFQLLF